MTWCGVCDGCINIYGSDINFQNYSFIMRWTGDGAKHANCGTMVDSTTSIPSRSIVIPIKISFSYYNLPLSNQLWQKIVRNHKIYGCACIYVYTQISLKYEKPLQCTTFVVQVLNGV